MRKGMTLAAISRETSLGVSKIKMIVNRHPELQADPYSVKAGKTRVYFPAFVEWLAKYEGAEASHKSHVNHKAVTNVTFDLPPATKMHELRLLAADRMITAAQVQRALGFTPDPPAIEEPEATPEEAAEKLGPVTKKLREITSEEWAKARAEIGRLA